MSVTEGGKTHTTPNMCPYFDYGTHTYSHASRRLVGGYVLNYASASTRNVTSRQLVLRVRSETISRCRGAKEDNTHRCHTDRCNSSI